MIAPEYGATRPLLAVTGGHGDQRYRDAVPSLGGEHGWHRSWSVGYEEKVTSATEQAGVRYGALATVSTSGTTTHTGADRITLPSACVTFTK